MLSCKSINRSSSVTRPNESSCSPRRSPNSATRASTSTPRCVKSTETESSTISATVLAVTWSALVCAFIHYFLHSYLSLYVFVFLSLSRLVYSWYWYPGRQRGHQLRFPENVRDLLAPYWPIGSIRSFGYCYQSHHLWRQVWHLFSSIFLLFLYLKHLTIILVVYLIFYSLF